MKQLTNTPEVNMQIIYILIRDCGDGSSCIDWFDDKELVDKVLEEDESYFGNEGSAATLTFPLDFDIRKCGIIISTAEDFE